MEKQLTETFVLLKLIHRKGKEKFIEAGRNFQKQPLNETSLTTVTNLFILLIHKNFKV